MYIEGIISEISGFKAKVQIPEFDNVETGYLSVLQLFTVNNKSGFKPEIGAVVAAVVNDDMSAGAILGQIYNGVDTPPDNLKDTEFIQFSDGVSISHVPGTGMLFLEAESLCINADVICAKDIEDKNGTIQEMREIYNSHVHTNGNQGSNTGIPTESME